MKTTTSPNETRTTRVADPELQALEKIGKLLSDFPAEVQERMIGYISQKFIPVKRDHNA